MKNSLIETDITYGEVKIPGGWEAKIPEIKVVDEETIRIFSRYFQQQGYRPGGAQENVLLMCQGVFDGGWEMKLRMSLGRWGKEYIKRFGSLDGFDPEKMQAAFCPGDNWGRAGKSFVNELMREMRYGD